MRAKNRLETLLMALTFAEAGEFETAKDMVTRRQVLLALEADQPAGHAVQCAVNLCTRVNARLDVLLGSSGDLPASVSAALADADLPYELIRAQGTLSKEIIHYVRSCRSVVFVVIESLDIWGADRTAKPWLTLGCPLVVATDGAATNSH